MISNATAFSYSGLRILEKCHTAEHEPLKGRRFWDERVILDFVDEKGLICRCDVGQPTLPHPHGSIQSIYKVV